jgi:hypothetical protein
VLHQFAEAGRKKTATRRGGRGRSSLVLALVLLHLGDSEWSLLISVFGQVDLVMVGERVAFKRKSPSEEIPRFDFQGLPDILQPQPMGRAQP